MGIPDHPVGMGIPDHPVGMGIPDHPVGVGGPAIFSSNFHFSQVLHPLLFHDSLWNEAQESSTFSL